MPASGWHAPEDLVKVVVRCWHKRVIHHESLTHVSAHGDVFTYDPPTQEGG